MGASKCSPEFRADAVALYRVSPGGTYASVAKGVGVNYETLRTWVRDAEQAARPGAGEATAMEKENRRLRARVKELELEREIRGGPRSILRPRPAGEPLPVR
ncbi:transposase [Streptomyces sioyaensis]|uniref:transposase n=1 Tax=Streptomyces sioyaensis TaxID=67364 RepID=UPI0033E69F7A